MEEGQDNCERLESFICEIIKGACSVMHEVQVHALTLIKGIIAVR